MTKEILQNPLTCEEEIDEYTREGDISIIFKYGLMRMESGVSATDPKGSSGWLWLPSSFPADVMIEWEFCPINNMGAAVVSFAVKDDNGFHILYYNRKNKEDRAFHIIRMIKDAGANEVAIGADPVPDVGENIESGDDINWYHMAVIKKSRIVSFAINGLEVLNYQDDSTSNGEFLTSGRIGLGQLAGLTAYYRDLKVTWI